jgi:L-aspartate oxidase
LASNSLLEGMVFGPRVIEAIARGKDSPDPTGAMRAVLLGEAVPAGVIGGRWVPARLGTLASAGGHGTPPADLAVARSTLQRAMTFGAGVVRTGASLAQAAGTVDAVTAWVAGQSASPAREEVANLATVAAAVLAAALAREESRGCHTRDDFPERRDAFRIRLLLGQ